MILAFDGASPALSVALASADGEPIATSSWTSAQRQSAELLPHMLDMLDGAGSRLAGLDAVAVGTGPGSFTGLRVAMALAKGLAYARHIPLFGVPSLDAWLAQEPQADAAVARAGAREAYVLPRGEAEVAIVDRERLTTLLRGRTVVAPAELADAFGLPDSHDPAAAPAIARMAAARRAEAPGGDDLHRLEPIYLRPPRGLTGSPEGEVRWL